MYVLQYKMELLLCNKPSCHHLTEMPMIILQLYVWLMGGHMGSKVNSQVLCSIIIYVLMSPSKTYYTYQLGCQFLNHRYISNMHMQLLINVATIKYWILNKTQYLFKAFNDSYLSIKHFTFVLQKLCLIYIFSVKFVSQNNTLFLC